MNQPHRPATPVPTTLNEFMLQALHMELDAAQRYADFADMMETHNNPEVGMWFRKMAAIEGKHATQIMAEMGWTSAPPVSAAPAFEGFEAAETASLDDVHYLMQPWHMLQLALANEQRAERFFAHLASVTTVDSVRRAALELQQEEHEHVELVQAWMLKLPQPDANWDHDPDPPRYDE
ncbi:MAG: ferritin family protein [Betaproteobacteria bacterium]